TIELAGVQTTEVADARQRERQEAVEELPHAVATQRGVGADRHALTQLELGDGLAGLVHERLLAGDRGEVLDGPLDQLRVLGGVADTHVDDDLRQTRHQHDVLELELLLQCRRNRLAVLGLETRGDLLNGLGHLRSPSRTCGRYAPSAPTRRSNRPRDAW